MDPIIIAVIVILIIVIALRMFLGIAKTIVKLAFIIVAAIVIWRVLQGM